MTISIRVVLASIVLFVALVTGLIIAIPLVSAGKETADDAATLLRDEIVSKQQAAIVNYFATPQSAVSTLISAARRGVFNWKVPESFHEWLIDARHLAKFFTYLGTDDGLAIWTSTAGSDAGVDYYNLINVPQPCTNATGGAIDNRYSIYYRRNTADGSIARNGTNPRSQRNSCYDPRTRPWYAPLKANQTWSNVYVNYGGTSTALTAGGPLYDPATSSVVGAFAIDFTTTTVVEYLQQVQIAKTGQMTLLDARQDRVLAVSWGESGTINRTGTFEMKTVTDLSHPHMDAVIGDLGASWVFQCAAPCRATVGSGRDKVFVDVVDVADEFGLALRLVVTIPESDFLQALWDQTTVSIVAAVCSVIVVMVLAVVVIVLVLRPLKRVEERLYLAATFEDDEVEDGRSVFTEVANMQEAHEKMTRELQRVRSFVPQSLLKTLDGNDDDDEMDGESSVGESTQEKSHGTRSISMDRSSRRSGTSQSSRLSAGSARAALVGGRGLKMAMGLVDKRVTLLAVNTRGFHSLAQTMSPAQLVAHHSKVLRVVSDLTSDHRGVVDSFSGDRFLLTFGAVTNVATHATRAANCALSLDAALKSQDIAFYKGLTMGLATGRALCGNMGTEGIRRFSIVGGVINTVHVLESLCRRYEASILMSFGGYESLQYDYHVGLIDVIRMPFAKAPAPIGQLLGSKRGHSSSVGDEEWMYTLRSDNGNTSIISKLNEAYISYARGRADEANALLEELTAANDSGKELVGLARLKELLSAGTAPDAATDVLGSYYTECMVRPEGPLMK